MDEFKHETYLSPPQTPPPPPPPLSPPPPYEDTDVLSLLNDKVSLLPNVIREKINKYIVRARCQYIIDRNNYHKPHRCVKDVGTRSRCRSGIYSEIYCPEHKKYDQTLYKYKW
jgi:hypothetical protein